MRRLTLILAALAACATTEDRVDNRAQTLANRFANDSEQVEINQCKTLYEESVKTDDPTLFHKVPQKCHDAVEFMVLDDLSRTRRNLGKDNFSVSATMMYIGWQQEADIALERNHDVLYGLSDMIRGKTPKRTEFDEIPDLYSRCEKFRAEYASGIAELGRQLRTIADVKEARVPQLVGSDAYQELKSDLLDTIDFLRREAEGYDCSKPSTSK
jgi:hypothetical protein